ncbi:3-galactosyl-N-acetylglucosaminide 4-alpha-L-fucosyltransferase FUT3-like isoform X1 [Dreissena polymorpha]|uniref:3-galactosyl-N-acetylglucosaminide 4-alpha-L-fucosyltransferase FUT3-like isoform X1 n=1 Tax=Dreissena polymorpha TaxID=45954 RepID=UPI002263D9FD|nr:3-galactosyl-N-acetylglucosaminide 4-alpha-L-fucosyltransferase FUT3-like isoform X1 [Dreissena polymorpha]
MLKLIQLHNNDCITKRRTFIFMLLLLMCFCIVYKQSEWTIVRGQWMNVSLLSLYDKNVLSNVSLIPRNYYNVTTKSPSVLRSELLILWYNKPVWINELLVNKTLGTCPYNNCFSTTNKALFNQSASVIYLISSGGMPRIPPISAVHRKKDQAWIFFNLEPQTLYGYNFGPEWNYVMNWSMMYHRDADIPYPYGTIELRNNSQSVLDKKNYSAIFDGKSVFASWFVSHCHVQSRRDEYVEQMQKYGVDIDIFGSCFKNHRSLPKNDPQKIDKVLYQSKFYLAFENSFCEDYVTEKFFERFNSDTIVVVRGGINYTKYFPPGTFVNAADFGNAKKLAEFLIRFGNDKDKYTAMLRRKDMYVSTQPQLEYCKSYCKLCEMLNNVDKYRKTYKTIREYVDSKPCTAPKDIE